MTPAEITVLLHYYTSPSDYNGEMNRKSVDEICQDFVAEGLLSQHLDRNPKYKITEKGKFYVEHGLCAVPFPIATFYIPAIKEIEG